MVMKKLADGLNTKPENKPTESEVLDKYERLIEHSVLAGHYDEAFDLYQSSMGGHWSAPFIFNGRLR